MTKKKIFILSFIFILIFIGVISYLVIKNQTSTSIPTSIKVIEIKSPIDSSIKVSLEIDEADFDFPDQTALLKVSPLPPVSEEEAKEVAQNLNLTNEPIVSKDVDLGKLNIFSSNEVSLVIYLEPNIFNYSINSPTEPVNKQLSDAEIISISKNFITDNFLVSPESIEFVNFNYKKTTPDGESIYITSKENADFIQVNFSPITNDLAVITLDPDSTPYYVWILPDGTIHATNIKKLGNTSETTETFDLKSFEEVANSLDQAKLISLDQGNIHLPDINSQYIKSVTINKIELAYLLKDPNSNLLQPIYILRGSANLTEPLQEVSAVLYMPAITKQ